jgi:CRISPR-associated protein Cmr3
MSTPSSWVIEPRDTLVVRDARSIKGTNRMRSLPFPLPPTVAGCVRTRIGPLAGDWPALLHDVELAGPWLVDLQTNTPLMPAPRDCYWTGAPGDDSAWHRHQLAPARTLPTGFATNLPEDVMLVEPTSRPAELSKAKNGPRFWRWDETLAWLTNPASGPALIKDGKVVLPGPKKALVAEERTHVGIEPEKHTARESALFSTEGLRFHSRIDPNEHTLDVNQFGIGFTVGGPRAAALQPGLVRLGGEGRISRLTAAPGVVPTPNDALKKALEKHSGRVRVLLLTPGLFTEGWRPSDDTLRRLFGEGARLVAACVDRPLTVSGWEILINPQRRKGEEKEMGPKASRRAVPAGSVYWVETTLKGQDLIQNAWMESLCDRDPHIDGEQAVRDGFGRMLLGVG